MALFRSLLLAAPALVAAHTWAECFDWQFSNPAAYKNPSLRRFYDQDGTCAGYPRNWNFLDFREGQRGFAFRNDGPCGNQRWGSQQPLAPPQAKAGEIMCVKWPAKNHYADTGGNRMVTRNMDGRQVRSRDVNIAVLSVSNTAGSNAQFTGDNIATLDYRDCPVEGNIIPGAPAAGDQQRGENPLAGGDEMMCGGCFTVPDRAPGVYDLRWTQTLNNNEDYFSCASLEVVEGPCVDPDKCAVVGVVTDAPTPAPGSGPPTNGACGVFLENWHFGPGGDGGVSIVTATARLCESACGDSENCMCFAWDTDDGECWMKAGAVCSGPGQSTAGITSGNGCMAPIPVTPVTPGSGGAAPESPADDFEYTVSLTVQLQKGVGEINVNEFLNDMTSILGLPADSIDSINIDLDRSNSEVTYISFVIVTVPIIAGGYTDPLRAAQELRSYAEDPDRQAALLEFYPKLAGMVVEDNPTPTPVLSPASGLTPALAFAGSALALAGLINR